MMVRRAMKRLAAVGLVTVFGALAGCTNSGDPAEGSSSGEASDEQADAERFTLRFANALTPQEVPSRAFDDWAAEVSERTDGRVTVEVFHSGQLLPPEDLTAALRDGQAQGGYLFPEFMEAEFPLYTLAGLPFTTMDAGAWMHTWNQVYEQSDVFRAELADAGAELLTHLPTVSGSMAFADDITSLDGLRGQRIRSFGAWAEALEQAGATPVFLSTTEALEGLERGVVDGIAPQDMITIVNRGMADVAPHLVQPEMGMFVGTSMVLSKDFWDSLPADLQQVLAETADAMAENMLSTWMDVGAEACAELREGGGDIVLLPEAERAQLESEVAGPIRDTWRAKAVQAGHAEGDVEAFETAYLDTLDSFESESDYVDPSLSCARGD